MIKNLAIAAIAAAAFGTAAFAAEPIYSPKGTPNAATYSFAAAADGELVAWYLGGFTVTYRSTLWASINGSAWSGPAFLTGAVGGEGSSFSFGPVSAGDTIEFRLLIQTPAQVAGNEIFSTPSDNANGGLQQIFSAGWGGGDFTYQRFVNGPTMDGSIPLGDYTFVAFEDILGFRDQRFKNDFDYNDHRFAFSNLRNIIPEPATWAMMITGFGLVGFAARRRKPVMSVAA